MEITATTDSILDKIKEVHWNAAPGVKADPKLYTDDQIVFIDNSWDNIQWLFDLIARQREEKRKLIEEDTRKNQIIYRLTEKARELDYLKQCLKRYLLRRVKNIEGEQG